MENIDLVRLILVAISVSLIIGIFYLKRKLLPLGEEYKKTDAIKFVAYVFFTVFYVMCVDAFLYYSYDVKQKLLFEILSGIWAVSFSVLVISMLFMYREFFKNLDEETETIVFVGFAKYILMAGLLSMLFFSVVPLGI